MKPEQYQRVREVYHRVCDEPPSQWGRLLEEICSGDVELRGHVERLLEIETREPGFLESPPPPPPVEAPERVGRYRIVRLIGEGGMGVVYEAEQDDPKRRVALKLIRPGMVSPKLLQRFRHEAQVLGQLRHQGIAQIYEAGTEDRGQGGQPYFAMELVTGRLLPEYAESQNLGTRDRLELVARVCDALHHAHQKGVIHRDLKPGNILVEAGGRPKILDFGVARATDADIQTVTMHTDVGELVGTVPYMSPEQASGEPEALDIRSDIYAIGVITYELLAGRLPYEIQNRAIYEAVRVIREEEPSRLSSVSKVYRGDVETIVAKALEKDKDRRYQSAAELAADIRRYLHDEPIAARPASTMYQLGKFARRNKAVVAATLVVFLGLAGATSVATGFAVSESRQRDRAEREVEVGQAIIAFLAEMLSAPNPWGSEGGEAGDREVRVVDVLDHAADGLDTAFADQPEVEAAIRTTLGTTYRQLGAMDEAQAHLERALALHTAEVGERHARTLHTMSELGLLYGGQSRYDEAAAMLSRVLEIHRQDVGNDHPLTLTAITNLAGLYSDGRYDEAVALGEEGLAIARRVLGEDHPETITAMGVVATAYFQVGRIEESLALHQEVLADRRRFLGPDHPDTIGAMNNTADTLKELGRFEESEALFEQALVAVTRFVGEDHPQTLMTLNNLVSLYTQRKRYEKAEPLAVKGLEAQRRVLGDDHRSTLIAVSRLARLYADLKRLDDAEPLYLEALDGSRRGLGERHPDTMVYMQNLATFYRENGRYEEAEPLFVEAVALARELQGDQHPTTLAITFNLGKLYSLQKRHDDAAPLYEKAVTGARQALPEGHWHVGVFLSDYGSCLSNQGHHQQAEAALLEAHEILLAALGEDHTRTRNAIKSIVAAYERGDQPEAAAAWQARLPVEQDVTANP